MRLPYDGIRVAGARSSPRSFAVKEFLSGNQIPYQWIDVDQDSSDARADPLVSATETKLPVVLFPDGSFLAAPTNRELAEKTGCRRRRQLPFYDLLIVGGGTGGTRRRGLRSLGRAADGARRAGSARRPGRHELEDRELPRLPLGRLGGRSRAARDDPGPPLRRRGDRARGRRPAARGPVPRGPARGRHRRELLRAHPRHGRVRAEDGGARASRRSSASASTTARR